VKSAHANHVIAEVILEMKAAPAEQNAIAKEFVFAK
jgi:hypothetical protein